MVQSRRSKSPDTDSEGEPLSEEEPEALPMAQWNIPNKPHAEDSTRAKVGPSMGVCHGVRVKAEYPRGSPPNTAGSKIPSSQAMGTSVVSPPNARPPRHLQLRPLSWFLARTKPSTAWEKPSYEQNPLYAFCHDPMMHINVMDTLVQYLQQHSLLASGMFHSIAVIPPTIYHLVLCSAERGSQHVDAVQAVWQHTTLPTYIVLPVVHNNHWFIWRGAVWKGEGSGWQCDLRYLSSVGRPPQDILDVRSNAVRTVVRTLFPQLRHVQTRHHYINGFKQAKGSSDCGLFTAQALSAFLFEQPGALEDLLPVVSVKQHIFQILKTCAGGVLNRISEGSIPEHVRLLHNHRSQAQRMGFLPTNGEDVVYLIPSLFPLLRRVRAPSLQISRPTQPGETLTTDTAGQESDRPDLHDSQQLRLPRDSLPSQGVEQNPSRPEGPHGLSLKCTITLSWEGGSQD